MKEWFKRFGLEQLEERRKKVNDELSTFKLITEMVFKCRNLMDERMSK